MALSLWLRILEMILAILEAFSEVLSIDLDELTENILNNETAAKKCAVMLKALREYSKANSHIRTPSKGGKLFSYLFDTIFCKVTVNLCGLSAQQ